MKTNYIDEYLINNLTPEKLVHTEGVVHMAVKLAKIYGVDVEKARLSAKYHDLAKCMDDAVLDSYIKFYKLPIKYMGKPKIAHAKVAEAILKEKFSLDDKEVLSAVSFHTTARYGMSLLEEIIYVADSIEVNRDYEGAEELRELACKNLHETSLKIINNTIERVTGKGDYLDEDTLAAKKYLEELLKEDIDGK